MSRDIAAINEAPADDASAIVSNTSGALYLHQTPAHGLVTMQKFTEYLFSGIGLL